MSPKSILLTLASLLIYGLLITPQKGIAQNTEFRTAKQNYNLFHELYNTLEGGIPETCYGMSEDEHVVYLESYKYLYAFIQQAGDQLNEKLSDEEVYNIMENMRGLETLVLESIATGRCTASGVQLYCPTCESSTIGPGTLPEMPDNPNIQDAASISQSRVDALNDQVYNQQQEINRLREVNTQLHNQLSASETNYSNARNAIAGLENQVNSATYEANSRNMLAHQSSGLWFITTHANIQNMTAGRQAQDESAGILSLLSMGSNGEGVGSLIYEDSNEKFTIELVPRELIPTNTSYIERFEGYDAEYGEYNSVTITRQLNNLEYLELEVSYSGEQPIRLVGFRIATMIPQAVGMLGGGR